MSKFEEVKNHFVKSPHFKIIETVKNERLVISKEKGKFVIVDEELKIHTYNFGDDADVSVSKTYISCVAISEIRKALK